MMYSMSVGWTCRNGHFNDRRMTTTACLECGAIRDPRDLYEDLPETSIGTPTMGKGQTWTDIQREKTARQGFNKAPGLYVCYRCAEMLISKPWNIIQQEAAITGVEQPGGRPEMFATKEDLKWHIRNVHKGKAFADKDVRKMRRESEKRQKDSGQ